MTLEDILKRAKQCNRRKVKWEFYEIYKQDIQRLGMPADQYQQAIRQLQTAMKI